ncbi:AraC family transcriptional regulator [Muricauda oceani]|uniref:Helix-turn-helix transcriptional regulator n=1 Tax=Flagellimonas oceani TaxID=2698672 RepID=A0A6G7J7E1_9FLAO|nr:AraC family transcriptional regulator [Allomuricauda oceani]MBW8241813.1 AraC family transcriptional regulator [Allomuricauda oceani]QII46736.1 helix-turn-helix transcriptional regulator [Allomuricauda oceani]
MKTNALNTVQLKNMFGQFQKNMGGDLHTLPNREYTLDINNDLGHGSIKGIAFKGGISYMEFDIEFYKEVLIITSSPEHSPICFAYCSQGQIAHSFGRHGKKTELESFQTGILTSRSLQDHILHFDKSVNLKMILIIVNPSEHKDTGKNLNKKLQKLFFKDRVADNFVYVGSHNLKVADKIHQLKSISAEGIAKKLMVEGLVHMVLALEIQQHSDDLKNADLRNSTLTKRERGMIQEVSEFIRNYIERKLSISYLCKKSGLSPSKLQEGFKLMHGTTVTDYIRDVRIQKAEDLIKNTDLNVSQVVYSIGFISRSYFSKIFKAKYNCSPKEYKDKQSAYAIPG